MRTSRPKPTRKVPEWSRVSEALHWILLGRTLRPALPVSAVVGTLLSAVNEGSAVIGGRVSRVLILRTVLNYVVPFLVASWGFLSSGRREKTS